MKKLIAFVLICVLGLAGCSTVNTEPDNYTTAVSKADAMKEITNRYVTEYMGLTEASCVLGNQLFTYRLTTGKLEPSDNETYPVFVEDKVVAFTTCTLGDTGDYHTGCGIDFAESFWQEYSKQPDAPIAIVYAREGAYLVREGDTPVLLHEMPIKGCVSIKELDNCLSSLEYSVI